MRVPHSSEARQSLAPSEASPARAERGADHDHRNRKEHITKETGTGRKSSSPSTVFLEEVVEMSAEEAAEDAPREHQPVPSPTGSMSPEIASRAVGVVPGSTTTSAGAAAETTGGQHGSSARAGSSGSSQPPVPVVTRPPASDSILSDVAVVAFLAFLFFCLWRHPGWNPTKLFGDFLLKNAILEQETIRAREQARREVEEELANGLVDPLGASSSTASRSRMLIGAHNKNAVVPVSRGGGTSSSTNSGPAETKTLLGRPGEAKELQDIAGGGVGDEADALRAGGRKKNRWL